MLVYQKIVRELLEILKIYFGQITTSTLYGDGIHMGSLFLIISNIYYYRLMFAEQKSIYD